MRNVIYFSFFKAPFATLAASIAVTAFLVLSGCEFQAANQDKLSRLKGGMASPTPSVSPSPDPSPSASPSPEVSPSVSPSPTPTVGPASLTTSTISVSSASIVKDQTSTITLVVKDADGNAHTAGGLTVTFTRSNGAGESQGTIGATTDVGNGTYTAIYTATVKGTANTITANINAIGNVTNTATITVANTAPTLTLASNRLLPLDGANVPLIAENSSDYTFAVTSGDADGDAITFGCTYESVGLGASDPNYAAASTNCTSLVSQKVTNSVSFFGNATFGADGLLTWRPTSSQRGTFKFTVTASDGTGTTSQSLFLSVRDNYAYSSNMVVGLDALYAYIQSSVSSTAPSQPRTDATAADDRTAWKHLFGSNTAGLSTTFTTTAPWGGTGTYLSPYHLSFNSASQDSLLVGNNLLNATKVRAQLWFALNTPADSGKTILSNVSGTNGFSIQQSTSTAGKIELIAGGKNYDYSPIITQHSPQLYFRLGESAGTVAANVGSSGTDGTYTGTFTLSETGHNGVSNTSVGFGGYDNGQGYVAADQGSTVTVGNYLSMGAWVYLTDCADTDAGTPLVWVINVGSATYPDLHGIGFNDNGNGTCTLRGQFNWDGVFGFASPTKHRAHVYQVGTTSKNEWHHVAMVIDGSMLRLYLDGVLVNTTTSTESEQGTYNTVDLADFNRVAIGRFASSASGYFNGRVDEAFIVTTALTVDQIQEMYLAGKYSKCESQTALLADQWAQAGVSIAGKYATLYLNGSKQCILPVATDFTHDATELKISAGTGGDSWSGKVSDLRVYASSNGDTVASDAIIKNDFNYTANRYRHQGISNMTTEHLILFADPANAKAGVGPHSSGCEASSLTYADLSNYANHGTLSSFTNCGSTLGWQGNGSSVADAYRLGVSDATNRPVVLFPDIPAYRITNAFTWEVWVKPDAADAPSDYVIQRRRNDGVHSAIIYGYGGNNGRFQFFSTDTGNPAAVSGMDVVNNNWVHVVYTYAGGVLKGYLNGTEMVNQSGQTLVMTDAIYTGGGFYLSSTINNDSFNGAIGPVAVYNDALTEQQRSSKTV